MKGESIDRIPLIVARYCWTVTDGKYGVSGWTFTKFGARRAVRRVPSIRMKGTA